MPARGTIRGEQIGQGKAKGRVYWLACAQCSADTKHTVLGSAEASGENDYGVEYEGRFQLVQFAGCEWISFRQSWSDLEGDPTGQTKEDEQLFPPRLRGRRELEGVHHLPPRVRGVYREVHGALVNDQPVLAALGIRTLVEAVCDAKKAPGKDLHTQIQSLVGQQLLTPSEAKLLQATRFLGNRSAHSAKPSTLNQLTAAMGAAEHLLTTVFLVKRLGRSLPRRNDRRPKHKT